MDLARIEQGIKEAIAALGRNYIREVASYGGEFDDELAEVVRRLPAVWVTFGGAGRPRRFTARDKWLVPLTFVVMVGARNLRNEEATRQGVMVNGVLVEVGTYQLLTDVNSALLGNDLGLAGVDSFEPGAVRTLYNTKLNNQALSVLAMEWHTTVQLDKPVSADQDNWLLQTNIDFLFQPGDETADLQAEVALEGDQGSFPDGRHTGAGDAEAG